MNEYSLVKKVFCFIRWNCSQRFNITRPFSRSLFITLRRLVFFSCLFGWFVLIFCITDAYITCFALDSILDGVSLCCCSRCKNVINIFLENRKFMLSECLLPDLICRMSHISSFFPIYIKHLFSWILHSSSLIEHHFSFSFFNKKISICEPKRRLVGGFWGNDLHDKALFTLSVRSVCHYICKC